MSAQEFDSIVSLMDELNDIATSVRDPIDILEIGVKDFINDLSKLSKPYSRIKSSNYTHLIDTFCYNKKKDEIEVGWGKYYGRMVEEGTKLTSPQPHLIPTFKSNKEKYYKKILNEMHLKG